ncbi:MAG: arsenosugar biosynthesis radical SAM protein ArsS [Mariprofundaceae bacterium]|nr:arsenosugar biosynthesis radical SAM protein ArsS [Mariprofundaceae bacterium]
MRDMLPLLEKTNFPAIRRAKMHTLQVNLGYLCNQTCFHCHVNAGPNRKELMSESTIQELISLMEVAKIKTLDLTGGAPEMNPHFKMLVKAARALDVHVIDRCNLTILEEDGYAWLAEFLAEQQVEVAASLPCYLADNVDAQRGDGVFQSSISGIQRLNALGYGLEGSDLKLNLVFNPQGTSLPPAQEALEADYKKELLARYHIHFNHLFTITNQPIQRFGSTLVSKGQFEGYMQLLKDNFLADNVAGVMCRTLISVDWLGYVYDCDFNQMLDLPAPIQGEKKLHITQLITQANLKQTLQEGLEGQPITIMDHCYACTAGQGSSCGGAL